MNTTSRGRSAILLVALLCGCRICQSPYDYCTAVTGPDGCPCFCDFGARMNSVYSPPAGSPPPAMGPTEAEPNRSPAPKSTRQTASARHRGFRDAPPELSADQPEYETARLQLPEAAEPDEESTAR